MKKALSIIVVFIALTNIVGFMPLYFAALQEIKSEVKLKLSDKSELLQVAISDAELNTPSVFHSTEDEEFSYMGRMYDYKAVKRTNGGLIYYALEDTKESGLIDFLKAAYGQNNGSDKSKAPLGNLLKSFSKDFVGCFSSPIVFPLSNISQSPVIATSNTCTGYYMLLQNPPDKDC